jgi:hypothetical protein
MYNSVGSDKCEKSDKCYTEQGVNFSASVYTKINRSWLVFFEKQCQTQIDLHWYHHCDPLTTGSQTPLQCIPVNSTQFTHTELRF